MILAKIVYSHGIQDAWSKIATFVPKLVGFFVVLIVGYFIAKTIAKILGKVLQRVGFDRAVERGGIKRTLEKSKYDASDLVGKLVFYTLFIFVLELAFGVFGPNPVSDLLTRLVLFLPKLLMAVLIVVVAAAIAAAVREIIVAALGELSYATALGTFASVSILVVGLFAAADEIRLAPHILNTLFLGLVAVVVGSAIVAIGGSGIQPMRQYWERSQTRMEQESENIKRAKSGAGDRIQARAQELKDKAHSETAEPDGTRTAAVATAEPTTRGATRPPYGR